MADMPCSLMLSSLGRGECLVQPSHNAILIQTMTAEQALWRLLCFDSDLTRTESKSEASFDRS